MPVVSEPKPTRGRPRNQARIEAKKGAILKAAARCFGEFGYAQTDINLIARDVGITKGTVYHYFGSKENLFFETIDAEMQRMKEHVISASDRMNDPQDEMCAAIHAYLEFAEENPHFVELLIEERSSFKDRKQNTYFLHRATTLPRWYRCVESLIEQGRVRRCDPERVVAFISDALYGILFTNYFTDNTLSAGEQAETVIDLVFSGLLIASDT